MELYLSEAEQLYKDHRYEEALAAYDQAIRLAMPDPDPRLYYGRAAVLERLAEQAHDTAKQGGYIENKQEEANPAIEANLKTVSLSALARLSAQEINDYRRGEVSSDQYSLELFRRAMLGNERAWAVLVECLDEYMLDLFRRHPRRDAASRIESPEHYVERAFERFWLAAVHNQQLEFTTLAAALSYMRACLNAAIQDTLRAYSRSGEVVSAPSYPEEPAMEDSEENQSMWETIQSLLLNERERRAAYLLFWCNLKPREIVRRCPQEFSDVQEIYRLKRNVVEQLLRSADQIRGKIGGSDM